MSLLEPHNLPFLIAFGALAVIAVLQLTGVSEVIEGAGEFDVGDNGADGLEMGGLGEALTTLLGLGRVPLLIWLAALLFVFATIGVIGQSVLTSMLGAPLSAGWAALLAGGAALPLNSIAMRPLAAILPRDETTAIELDDLVRRDAEIQIGTARAGSPARAKVIDVHGQAHFVMVEPHDQTLAFNAGDTVLLVRREGQIFYGVQYESPLLGLDS
ncbi:YqiJ family protein [Porphyrobacter sp. ULC335]|uniref:YqiJ family protein n=1 Tax=Porphyrobacter sp. ULC335 TaxID=2854260 RepID=UPI002220CCF8|nr:YqiJ family protein [Porphyrobacter sp. ULC335]UYV16313.1 YqiJ family protein [Porphyrobacter sp. ULC335]